MNSSIIRYLAQRMGLSPFETGTSADAMVREAIGGAPVEAWEYPADYDDLHRCYLAYKHAPRRLKRRMRPILANYRDVVRERPILGRADVQEGIRHGLAELRFLPPAVPADDAFNEAEDARVSALFEEGPYWRAWRQDKQVKFTEVEGRPGWRLVDGEPRYSSEWL